MKVKKISIYFIFLFLTNFFFPLSLFAAQKIDVVAVEEASQNAQINEVEPIFLEEDQNEEYNFEDIPAEEFFRAKVVEIIDEQSDEISGGYTEIIQTVAVKIFNGKEKGTVITTTNGGVITVEQFQRVEVGDSVILVKTYNVDGTSEYFITDHYRIWLLIFIFVLFIALAIFFGRLKAVGSLFGLLFSILVLAKFIVPRIISGQSPFLVTMIGVIAIASISLYLAHGFNKRTSVAFASTLITLFLTIGFSEIFVRFAYLFGRGTEEAFYIQIGEFSFINLRGLLLAGIIIGVLGVLDDVTTTQTAVVGELRLANPLFSIFELYKRGLIVGREHIASLVNTLVLAYAGASLPLFILFGTNQTTPAWIKFNSELIAEEFIRTIIGSSALILAVPIATFLAAYFLKNEKIESGVSHDSSHHVH